MRGCGGDVVVLVVGGRVCIFGDWNESLLDGNCPKLQRHVASLALLACAGRMSEMNRKEFASTTSCAQMLWFWCRWHVPPLAQVCFTSTGSCALRRKHTFTLRSTVWSRTTMPKQKVGLKPFLGGQKFLTWKTVRSLTPFKACELF